MEEMEVPTEHLHEKIQEESEGKGGWTFYVALSTALMAVLAAVSSLMAGDNANEAVIYQVKASDSWSYYQAKSIKSELAAATIKIMGAPPVEGKSLEKYEQDKEAIKTKAEDAEKTSEYHLSKHRILAKAVTMFQVAIAIAAISLISKRKFLWVISILISIAGTVFLVHGAMY